MSRSKRSTTDTKAKATDTKPDAPAAEASEPPAPHVAAPPQPTEDERRAAAKRPQDRVSTKERSERQVELDAVKQELLQARSLLQRANKQIADLERDVGHLRLAPGRAIPMSPLEVREHLTRDARATFRVLDDYRHMTAVMPKGRELDARHYPRLMDHVTNGLQLVLVEKPKPATGQTR